MLIQRKEGKKERRKCEREKRKEKKGPVDLTQAREKKEEKKKLSAGPLRRGGSA